MRSVPKLQFIYDKTAIRGQELSYLIERAVREDSLHVHDEEPTDEATPSANAANDSDSKSDESTSSDSEGEKA